MFCRYGCRPLCRDAGKWAPLLFGRSDARALRLCRLRGHRLAEAMSAELLLAELLAAVGTGSVANLDEDDRGMPFFRSVPLFVSLTHSGGFAAAAVADVPVGIDLQEQRKVSDGLLRRCCSEEERAWISAGDRSARAMQLWTMKEAQVKLTGDGIAGGIRFFASVSGDTLQTEYEDISFFFPEAPEGLAFSVCLLRRKDGENSDIAAV